MRAAASWFLIGMATTVGPTSSAIVLDDMASISTSEVPSSIVSPSRSASAAAREGSRSPVAALPTAGIRREVLNRRLVESGDARDRPRDAF